MVIPLNSSEVERNSSGVLDEEDFSISFSISSESLVSAVPSSLPSPLNSSEVGSFYNSLRGSSLPSDNDDNSVER